MSECRLRCPPIDGVRPEMFDDVPALVPTEMFRVGCRRGRSVDAYAIHTHSCSLGRSISSIGLHVGATPDPNSTRPGQTTPREPATAPATQGSGRHSHSAATPRHHRSPRPSPSPISSHSRTPLCQTLGAIRRPMPCFGGGNRQQTALSIPAFAFPASSMPAGACLSQ
jgi:hypothetical protein